MKNFDFTDFDREQFEGKDRFEENAAMKKALLHHVLQFMPVENNPLELEFFFYTDAEEKAQALCSDLERLAYSITVIPENAHQWSITGSTQEMEAKEEVLEKWVLHMCELGYKNDCHFDGWGMGFNNLL